MYVCRKVKNSQARTGHQRGMGGRWTDDDDTHERHTDTNRLTRHTASWLPHTLSRRTHNSRPHPPCRPPQRSKVQENMCVSTDSRRVSRALRGGRGKEEPLSAIATVLQAAPGDDGLPPPGPPRHTSAAQCLTTRTREASPRAGYPAHGSACQPRIHASVVRAHGIQAFARQRRG